MAAEERRIISNSMDEEDPRHRFPAGLRVLAVDDDPTCLKVLEQLLRSCHYHVTTTNQAMVALNILRENRNNFDIVITDVKMPDMDGLKLLELVGLEMDLPVIMMSAHGDTKLVMEGISHGACDYLLKPVRIEEIKNIWQHVMRKKTFGGVAKVRNISPSGDKAVQGTGEGGHGQDAAALGNGDQNGRANRKRKEKEQDEDDDEDEDDNENENEEPGSSSNKKPRVVWTVELHQRFVQAVNELGVEKAVPKKILDKMNDERLTRENVASHLQKYRLYLRRINGGVSQDGSALGSKDAYLRALEGFRDFRSFPGTARLSNAALSTYMPGGMLSRLNSPSGLNMRGLPSGIIQPGQSSSSPIGTFGKLQPSVLPTNQNSSLFQGIPTSFGVSQLNPISNQMSFAVSSSFPTSFSSNSLSTMSSNPLILQGNMQNTQSVGGIGSSSSTSLNPEPFNIGASCSSSFLGRGNWSSAAQFSRFQSNSLPLTQQFSHDQLPSLSEGFHSSGLPIQRSPTAIVSVGMEDLGGDMQGQVGFINNVIPNMNFTSNQRWENNSNQAFSSLDSLIPANGGVGSFSQGLGQNSTVCTQNMESTLIGDFNGGANSHIQNNEVNRSAMNTMMKSPEDYTEQVQSQANYVQNGFESLEDLMASSPWMIKREQGETLLEGDFVFGDGYSPDSYIQET